MYCDFLSLSRLCLVLLVGAFLSTNAGCGGSAPTTDQAADGGSCGIQAANSTKIVLLGDQLATCQSDLSSCRNSSVTADAMKRAAAAQDTRRWTCTSKDGNSVLRGQWEETAKLDTKNNIFVVRFLVDGAPSVACPSIGDLRSLSADDRFFCRQQGNQPFSCSPLP